MKKRRTHTPTHEIATISHEPTQDTDHPTVATNEIATISHEPTQDVAHPAVATNEIATISHEPMHNARARILVRGIVRELGVIQTPEGDFIGFPLLTVLNAPLGAEFIGILVESEGDHEQDSSGSELGD